MKHKYSWGEIIQTTFNKIIMQRITKFSAIIGFLAVMTFVVGMFMYMPTISQHGASLSPVAALAWGSGCGGCGDGDGDGDGDGGYNNPRPVCTLTASPRSITKGESATLTWTTQNASMVKINQSIGNVARNGSHSVSPTETTTYTLTAYGTFGSAVSCQTKVTVTTPVPDPVCTLDAHPVRIKKGESSTLTWTTRNAVKVTLNNGEVAQNNSRVVTPLATRTFTLVATNEAGKSVTCEKRVVVEDIQTPDPVCTLDADRNSIRRGQSATLTWNTTNADSVSINRGIGAVALDGSRTVSPTDTITYTLTATGNGKTVTCAETIVVNDIPPPTLSCDAFYASPSHFNDEDGGYTTLTWNTTGATSVSIDEGVGSVADDGSRSVYVGSDRTFTLTASNGSDSVQCRTTVTVDEDDNDSDSRPYCTFRASDKTIEEGDTVKLSWDTRRGEELTIKDNDGDKIFDTDDEDEVEEGDITVSPKEDTTYTLKVYDRDNDTDTCSVRIEVDEKDEDEVIVTSIRDRQPVTTISFRQVPYTGFDAGPTLAITFYSLLALWALVASYIIVVKKGSVLGFSLATIGMGAAAPVVAHAAPVVARTATPTAPANLPIALDDEDEEEEVEEDEVADDEEDISLENRAFAAGMILSKDALAAVKRAGETTTERLTVLDAIIARAKESYPREDGWIALDKARIAALFVK